MESGADAELMRGERRIVSVLFADIVGSTERISTLDPEDAQEFLDEILHRMIENIHAHGGSVTQTLGDGVMAVFGAPTSNEDHALCACLAGIAIRESIDKSNAKAARVRVGIHSGPAIIRWGGNDFGRELKSVGSTVHVAARIEKMCPENGVAISNVTLGLAAATVKSRKIGRVRDAADNVTVLELVSLKPQGGSVDRRIRGRSPNRLVGRRAELTEINRIIAACLEGRSSALAFVSEAGIGKSRLAHEAELRAIRANVSSEVINGFAANVATPFSALRPFALRFVGGDLNAERALERLRQRGFGRRESLGLLVLAGGAADNDEEWKALGAGERNRALIDGGVQALLARARAGPLLLIVEDVHYLDNETAAFLRNVETLQKEAPFALVATARPERLDFVRGICGKVVELRPLAPAPARKLAESEIGALAGDRDDARRSAMVDAVVSRAGGIPLALEEFSRMLRAAQSGHGFRHDMPISVENAFNTRLGQLPSDARALAQAASIFGSDFDLELLRATAGLAPPVFAKSLSALVDQRFIELLDDTSARFSHQLMQENCYTFTAKSQRQILHRAAHSASLTSRDPRHNVSQELARHALGAGDHAKALQHLWHACIEAIDRAALRSVAPLYARAKAVCDELGPAGDLEAAKFTLLVFDVFQQLADQEELVGALEAAKRTTRISQNERGAVQAEVHLAVCHWIAGRHQKGLVCAQEGLRGAGDFLPLQSYAEFTLANLEFANGFVLESTARLRRLIELLTGDLATARFGATISVPGAMARAFASWYLCYIGEFAEAERYQRQLAESAKKLDHTYSRLLGQVAYGFMKLRSGDAKEAAKGLSIAHEACWEGDFHGLEPCISSWYAQALLELGRIGQAQAVLERSIANGNHERIRNVNRYSIWEAQAKLQLSLGNFDAALSAADEAMRVAQENYDPIHASYGAFIKGVVHAARDETEQAQVAWKACSDEATRLNLTPLAAQARAKLAAL